MWIIGGVVAGILFGPKRSKSRRSKRKTKFADSVDVPVEHSSEQNQFCIACGSEYPIRDQFCPQCGTAAYNKNASDNDLRK